MNKANNPGELIKFLFVIGLLAAATGCAAGPGRSYYDGAVLVSEPGPDMFLFGGEYYRGRDARNYSHRGHESRGAAHPVGATAHSGGGAAHPGGGWQGGRR